MHFLILSTGNKEDGVHFNVYPVPICQLVYSLVNTKGGISSKLQLLVIFILIVIRTLCDTHHKACDSMLELEGIVQGRKPMSQSIARKHRSTNCKRLSKVIDLTGKRTRTRI